MADAAQRWEPSTTAGSTGTSDVQQTAREQAENLKETVRDSSSELGARTRGWMEQEAGQRTAAAAAQARTIAGAMRQTSDSLQREGQPQAARVNDVVADRVDQLASYLEQTDGRQMIDDIRQMARRNPWAFAAGGLLLGFAASRFMKASRDEDRPSSPGRSMPMATSYDRGTYAYPASGASPAGAYGATGAPGS